jgi:prepilin-type N-terminal cleavage/methylation domain-containing protein
MTRNVFHRGLTLPEVLLVLALFAVVGVAMMSFFGDIFSSFRSARGNLGVQESLQKTLRQWSAEARSASPSSEGAFALATTSTSTFSFYVDINGDGLKERVRYFKQGTDIRRGVVSPSSNPVSYNVAEVVKTLVSNVQATSTPLFQYYGAGYTVSSPPLAQPVIPGNVRLVKMTVVIEDSSMQPLSPIIGTTQVSIRSLKDNL